MMQGGAIQEEEEREARGGGRGRDGVGWVGGGNWRPTSSTGVVDMGQVDPVTAQLYPGYSGAAGTGTVVQEYRSTVVQEYRSTGVQEYRL